MNIKTHTNFLKRVALLKTWLAQFPVDDRTSKVWTIIALIEHPDDFQRLATEEAGSRERLAQKLSYHIWELESAPRRLREEVAKMKAHFPAEKYPHAGDIPEA